VIDPVAWMKSNAASEFSRVVVGKTCDPLAANVNTCSDTDLTDIASLIATADSVPPTIGIAGSMVSEPESRTVCGVDTMAIGTYTSLNPSVICTLAALVNDGLVIWMEVAAITGVDAEFPMMMNVPTAFIDTAPASCTATGTFDVSIITQGARVPMDESDSVIDELAGTTFSITPTDAYTLAGNARGIRVVNPPEEPDAPCATVAVPAMVMVDDMVPT